MLFTSIPFLYYFLPMTVLLYLLIPSKGKNIVLLISSLFFYAWGEPRNVFLMLLSILPCYCFALLIEQSRGKKSERLFCAASIIISLSFLLYFKYMNFFLDSIQQIYGGSWTLPSIALPIGISFYTFQMISYTVDVLKGEQAQKNLFHLTMYVVMFPQLIAGPIVRYHDISNQLSSRVHSLDYAAEGIRRFIFGMAKKILIADQLGELCAAFQTANEQTVLFYWLYALAVMFQLYFDFSGYSDMAIGLGKLFGFTFPENFDHPLISSSISEFWRRWHISLGSWFRDYVYIPLGGSRKGTKRQIMNILLVWGLTGFWHGAAWNFLIWGLYFAFLLIVEKLWLYRFWNRHHYVAHIATLLLILISFLIFSAESIDDIMRMIGGLFAIGTSAVVSSQSMYYLKSFCLLLLFAAIGSTTWIPTLMAKIGDSSWGKKVLLYGEPVVLVTLLLIMTAYLVDGSFSPFLYFRF